MRDFTEEILITKHRAMDATHRPDFCICLLETAQVA